MRRRERVLVVFSGAWALQPVFLLGLLAAAARSKSSRPSRAPRLDHGTRFAVLIPAHDEGAGVAAALSSVAAQDYPRELVEVILVADNCTDDTADIGRAHGVHVWERTEPQERGKGPALTWALRRLLAMPRSPDAIVFLDADCVADPGLLRAFDSRVAAGTRAAQCRYEASNPEASASAALRYAGMVLFNNVRLEGKQALGVSSGLSGTGMCLTADLLREVPWSAASLSEDIEQHAKLVRAGVHVEFVPEVRVVTPAATTRAQAQQQELRWEAGRLAVARGHGLPLVAQGMRQRDRSKFVNGLDLLTLPHSAWAAGAVAAGIVTLATRSPSAAALVGGGLLAEFAYVIGGLRHAQAPPAVRAALVRAPLLITAKLPLLVRVAVGRGPTAWVRTTRGSS